MATGKLSGFASQAVMTLAESAANTFTTAKLETAVGVLEKVAMIVHRVDYFLNIDPPTLFNSTADHVYVGLTVSSVSGDFVFTNPAVITMKELRISYWGSPANATLFTNPVISEDFTSLPNGGLIVPANPIYGAAIGYGCAVASQWYIRFWYSLIEGLTPDDFWALVQSRRLLTGT